MYMRYLFLIPKRLMKRIALLRSSSWIDKHAYRDTVVAAYSYRYQGPIWVNDIDPVWIIIVAPIGSYRDHCLIQ